MKSMLCLIAICLFSTTYAENVNGNFEGSIEIKTTCHDETTEINLNFTSIEDFQEFDEDLLENVEDRCTVSISVSAKKGSGPDYVSVTLKADNVPYHEVKEKMEDLKKSLIESLQ